MRSYKRHIRRKRLLKRTTVIALLFILGFVLLQAASIAIQGEIPVINSFNLFRKEADTSFGWNLILVNGDHCIPSDYDVELTELSNGEKVDSLPEKLFKF